MSAVRILFFTRYDTAATSFAQQVGRLMATTFRTFVLRAFRYAFHALVGLFVERKAVWLAVRAVLGEFLDEEYSDDLFFNKYIAMLCTGHDCTIDERGDLQLLASPAPTDNEGKIVSASGRDTITALKKVNMLLLIYRVSSFYLSQKPFAVTRRLFDSRLQSMQDVWSFSAIPIQARTAEKVKTLKLLLTCRFETVKVLFVFFFPQSSQ